MDLLGTLFGYHKNSLPTIIIVTLNDNDCLVLTLDERSRCATARYDTNIYGSGSKQTHRRRQEQEQIQVRVRVPIAKSESDRRHFPNPEVQVFKGQAPIVKSESNKTPVPGHQLLPKSQEKTSVVQGSGSSLIESPSNLPYRGRDTAETHEDKHTVTHPSPSFPEVRAPKTASSSSIRDRRREPEGGQAFKIDESQSKVQDDHKQRDISYLHQDSKKPIRDVYDPLTEGFRFTDFIPNDLPLSAQRDLERSMRRELSQADRPGYVYVYEICDPNGSPDTIQLKVGRSNNPVKRMKEWYSQCGLPQGEYLFFETTWCHRLERLVHIEMRALEEMQLTQRGKSAYRVPQKCPGCSVTHREIFEIQRVDGEEWKKFVEPLIRNLDKFVKLYYV